MAKELVLKVTPDFNCEDCGGLVTFARAMQLTSAL